MADDQAQEGRGEIRLPAIGDVLGGKHRIEEVIGEGGFGCVYRATRVDSDRKVAIKVLKPGKSGYDPRAVARFMRELRTIAKLQNPHTLTLYDHGRTDAGVLYMVTEFVEGEDLAELLQRRKRLSEWEVAHVLRQVLDSLGEAHALGLLHRDVKPSNIRVFTYGGDSLRVKLLDFGLAKPLQNDAMKLTGTGKVVGTPRFMSPEQLRGQELTAASDIFSLGLVAVELLLGRPAVRAWDIGSYRMIELDDPVSPELRSVVNGMLDKQVSDRFQSTAHVLTALDSLPPLPREAPVIEEAGAADHVESTHPTVDALPVTVDDTEQEAPALDVTGQLESDVTTKDLDEQSDGTLDDAATPTVRVAHDDAQHFAEQLKTLRRRSPAGESEQESRAPRVRPSTALIVMALGTLAAVFVVVVAVVGLSGRTDGGAVGRSVAAANPCESIPPAGGYHELRGWGGTGVDVYHAWLPLGLEAGRRYPLVLVLAEDNPGGSLEASRIDESAVAAEFVAVASSPDAVLEARRAAQETLCLSDAVYAIGVGAGADALVEMRCELQPIALGTLNARPLSSHGCRHGEPPQINITARADLNLNRTSSCGDAATASAAAHRRLWMDRLGCGDAGVSRFDAGECADYSCTKSDLRTCNLYGGRPWVTVRSRCDGEPWEADEWRLFWEFFTQPTVPTVPTNRRQAESPVVPKAPAAPPQSEPSSSPELPVRIRPSVAP